MHECMVNRENKILHFIVFFQSQHVKKFFGFFQRNMPRMISGAVMVTKIQNRFFRELCGIPFAGKHGSHKPCFYNL